MMNAPCVSMGSRSSTCSRVVADTSGAPGDASSLALPSSTHKTLLAYSIPCPQTKARTQALFQLFLDRQTSEAQDLELLQPLITALEQGIDLNFRSQRGTTFLHIAAQNGWTQIAQILLQASSNGQRINVNAQRIISQRELTARELQCINDKLHSYHSLLNVLPPDQPPDPRLTDIWNSPPPDAYASITPLHDAACGQHAAMVALLLQHGARADAPSSNGYTPIHIAIARYNTAIAQQLLDSLDTIEPTARTLNIGYANPQHSPGTELQTPSIVQFLFAYKHPKDGYFNLEHLGIYDLTNWLSRRPHLQRQDILQTLVTTDRLSQSTINQSFKPHA